MAHPDAIVESPKSPLRRFVFKGASDLTAGSAGYMAFLGAVCLIGAYVVLRYRCMNELGNWDNNRWDVNFVACMHLVFGFAFGAWAAMALVLGALDLWCAEEAAHLFEDRIDFVYSNPWFATRTITWEEVPSLYNDAQALMVRRGADSLKLLTIPGLAEREALLKRLRTEGPA